MRGRLKQKKTKQMMHNKQRDALLQFSIVFLFHWIQKWLLLLLPWPQMLSVFLNCIACFNLLEAQDWWRLFHLEALHIIRNVDITNHPTHLRKIMKFTSQKKNMSYFLFCKSETWSVSCLYSFHSYCCCLEDNMKVHSWRKNTKKGGVAKRATLLRALHGYQWAFSFKLWEVIMKARLNYSSYSLKVIVRKLFLKRWLTKKTQW